MLSTTQLPTPYPPPILEIYDTTTDTGQPTSLPSPSPTHGPFGDYLASGLSTPAILGFVGTGALLLVLLALCIWRRLTGRNVPMPSFIPRRYIIDGPVLRGSRRQQRGDDHESEEKPVIFEAWTMRRTTDVLKWEESVPVSATLFTGVAGGEYMGERAVTLRVGVDNDDDDDDDEAVEKKVKNEKQLAHQSTESRLQVAVLLQMPSPIRPEAHNKVNKEALECSVRGELAIGLMEVPWTREDHSSRSSTSSSS